MAFPTQGYLNAMSPDFGVQTQKPAAGLFEQFGIQSPSEKQAKQQQMLMANQMYQQQLRQQAQSLQLQRDQMQQNQANSAGQLGSSFSFPTFLAAGGLNSTPRNYFEEMGGDGGGGGDFSGLMKMIGKGKQQGDNNPDSLTPMKVTQEKQAGGIPMSADSDSIASKIVNDAFSQYGDTSQAATIAGRQLSALGQQRQDQHLASIGANLMAYATKKQKEEADLADKQASTAATKQKTQLEANQASNPGNTFQVHTPNGDLATMAPQYDKGKFTGYKVISSGPNKQITANEGLTDTQVGANIDKFTNLVTNTDATISAMRTIKDNLNKGSAQGWTATGVTFMNNIKGTLEQLANSSSKTPGAEEALSKFGPTFQEWADKTGVNDSIWNDLVSNLAKTYNPTGTITEKDITRAAKTVGQNISNPQTVAKVLEDAERRSREFVDKTYKYSNKKVQELTKDQYNSFLQTFTPGATGPDTEETSIDDDPKNREPSWDEAPAGTPAPRTQAEYDALPKGAQYWNPWLRAVVPKR